MAGLSLVLSLMQVSNRELHFGGIALPKIKPSRSGFMKGMLNLVCLAELHSVSYKGRAFKDMKILFSPQRRAECLHTVVYVCLLV